jgi:hypothetical protein
LKRESLEIEKQDAKRLLELVASVWRINTGRIMSGKGRRGATARNVACAILSETVPDAWRACGYRSENSQRAARCAMVQYMDCPVDGARIHRLVDLVRAEMPHLLAKLVVPDA